MQKVRTGYGTRDGPVKHSSDILVQTTTKISRNYFGCGSNQNCFGRL